HAPRLPSTSRQAAIEAGVRIRRNLARSVPARSRCTQSVCGRAACAAEATPCPAATGCDTNFNFLCPLVLNQLQISISEFLPPQCYPQGGKMHTAPKTQEHRPPRLCCVRSQPAGL